MHVCVEGGGGGGGEGDENRSWRRLRWRLLLWRRWRRQWMAPPRLSDEQKELSRQRRRDRRRELQRLRRADPEYRLAERARNTQARREQRNDPEYRQKERERDTRAHRERRNRVDAVMRNVTGSLWTNGNDLGHSSAVCKSFATAAQNLSVLSYIDTSQFSKSFVTLSFLLSAFLFVAHLPLFHTQLYRRFVYVHWGSDLKRVFYCFICDNCEFINLPN